MRVAFFTESYDPIINGVSTSVKTLGLELIRAGHEPVVVAPETRRFRDDTSAGSIPVIRIPSWRTPLNPDNPFAYPPIGALPRALRGQRFDIVHAQQPFGMGMHGNLVAERLGVPLISTFHTLYTEYTHYFRIAPASLSRRILSALMRRHYQNCSAVVVPSREAGRRLEALGVPAERLRVIPTGVPGAPIVLPAAIDRVRQEYQLPVGVPVLLYVGRVAREKNLDLLLDAYARVCRLSAERSILLIVGSGPYWDACRQRIRAMGLESGVRFTGYISRDKLAPIYQVSSLFCFPSLTETQGVVLSEAQSHGLPCVAADGGGAPEFVRPGVDTLLVPNQSDAFADAILELLNDPARRRAYSAAARESPLRPTPIQMAERVMALYAEVLAQPGGQGNHTFKYRSNQA